MRHNSIRDLEKKLAMELAGLLSTR